MEKYIIELSEIRGKLLHAIDTKDELYAIMQVNNIDNLLYAMNEESKTLQASEEQSKLNLADVSKPYLCHHHVPNCFSGICPNCSE
jgi:hypothetical protein